MARILTTTPPTLKKLMLVLVVVLGAERLEHELRRLEPPWHVELARDELVDASDRGTLATS